MLRSHAVVVLGVVAGCLGQDAPRPDVSRVTARVRWTGPGARTVAVSVPDDIPCSGAEEGLLGDSGIECESAPWTLTIDGVAVETTPVTCTSAHDGLFGHVPKRCSGGQASAPLAAIASEDVELVASTDQADHRVTMRGVRRTYTWTEERPFGAAGPGLVRVPGAMLAGGAFDAELTGPAGEQVDGSAQRSGPFPDQIELRVDLDDAVDGAYRARVAGYLYDGRSTFAVPIEGTFTVDLP